MNSILICPDKKKNHKPSHQLLSEKVKEIRDKCNTKYPRSKITIGYRRHRKFFRRWIYHMHPKIDEKNPYSKFYSRIKLNYNSKIREKYKTFYLPEKSKPRYLVLNNIEPEIDEKYFAKKKLIFKSKAMNAGDYRKGNSVENELIRMYFE